ncbi:MAG: 6-phospho-beta-glucosidase [Sulfobacillus thermosulfidooxidans]|nr:MAG: 6-phospho-beta-glucosidase [Sulfobacillus thermosulfidooxidans]
MINERDEEMMKISGVRIVIVGGGSSYTPELVMGLLEAQRLSVDTLTLVDVPAGQEKMDIVADFCRRLIKKAGSAIRLETTYDRKGALAQADFVLTQFRVGGLAARAQDERIPLRYGAVGQETVGAGGFAKALRTIPVALELAKELETVNPNAWLINFTNPSGMVTQALLRHTAIRSIGLCNVPITIARTIAKALAVDPEAVSLDMFGLNHLSFVRGIYVNGQNITSLVLEFLKNPQTAVANIPDQQWNAEVIGALGMVPNPYLQYYWNPGEMVQRQRQEVEAGRGTRADIVMKVEQELFADYRNPEQFTLPEALMRRGGAYYSAVAVMLIESLALNQRQEIIVNVRNGQALPELPEDSVVEVPAMVDGRGAIPLTCGPMPASVRGLIQHVKAYEELTIDAAVTGSRQTALAALMNNPLVPSEEVARYILRDILQEHAAWLPQFA